MSKNSKIILGIIFGCGSLLFGCSPEVISQQVSDSTGIQIHLEDGIEVEVPPGSLYNSQSIIMVQEVKEMQDNTSNSYLAVGSVYDVNLDGDDLFEKPIIIRIPYDEDKIPPNRTEVEIFPAFEYDGNWYREYGEVDTINNTITVYTLHNGAWTAMVDTLDNWAGSITGGEYGVWYAKKAENPTNISEAKDLVSRREKELMDAFDDLDWELQLIDEQISLEAVKKDFEEIGEHIIVHAGSEALIHILSAWGGKSAIIYIGGVPALIWGAEVGTIGYGIYRASIISSNIGAVLAEFLRFEYALERYNEALALLWILENPDARNLDPAMQEYLRDYYNSLPISQTQTFDDKLDFSYSIYDDEAFEAELAPHSSSTQLTVATATSTSTYTQTSTPTLSLTPTKTLTLTPKPASSSSSSCDDTEQVLYLDKNYYCRKEPDKNSEEMWTFNKGDTLEILEYQNGWYKIKFSDPRTRKTSCWIGGGTVKTVSSDSCSGSSNSSSSDTSGQSSGSPKFTFNENAFCRAGTSSSQFEEVWTFYSGDTVDIIGKDGTGWYKIEFYDSGTNDTTC